MLDRFLATLLHLLGHCHDEVLAEMWRHDVQVLPILYEGLALVLQEAMACVLTVITLPIQVWQAWFRMAGKLIFSQLQCYHYLRQLA